MKAGHNISGAVYTVLLSVTIAGIVTALASSGEGGSDRTCSRVSVHFHDRNHSLSEAEVMERLASCYGGITGVRLSEVSLDTLEKIVRAEPSVSNAEAYFTRDSGIVIEVRQRKAVIRLEGKGGSFLCDKDGSLFPCTDAYDDDIPVVEGNVEFSSDPVWTSSAIALVTALAEDRQWGGNIETIRVDNNGEFILTPYQSKVSFLIGNADDLDSKLGRIRKYYEYIEPATQQKAYKTINVKYRGQIICR